MKYLGILALIMWMIPALVRAEIRITEIAWMGTSESSFAEWFELHNTGGETVDLSGWKLYKDGGAKIVFTLTKTIPAGGYLLVERTTPSVTDPVPSVSDESGPFSNSGFANDGEFLVLQNNIGTTIQSLDYSGGWPSGDAATRQTMQWSGTSWITRPSTPKNPSAEEDNNVESNTEDIQQEENVDSKNVSKGSVDPIIFKKIPDHIEFLFPKTVYRNVPYEYDAVAFFRDMPRYDGYFVWNMGDGGTFSGTKNDGIVYTYVYPGVYTTSFSYYNKEHDTTPLLQSYKTVSVIDPSLTLSQYDNRSISIKNSASVPVDISKWSIDLNSVRSTFSSHTMIGSQATVTFPASRFGLQNIYSAKLYTPTNELVAYLGQHTHVKTVQKVKSTTTISTSKQAPLETSDAVVEIVKENTDTKANHRTRRIIFGAVILVVIGACLLLDRIMIRRE